MAYSIPVGSEQTRKAGGRKILGWRPVEREVFAAPLRDDGRRRNDDAGLTW